MRIAENINKLTKEPREKKKELLNQPKTLDSIICESSKMARSEGSKAHCIVKEYKKL